MEINMYLIKSTFRIDVPSKSIKMKIFDRYIQSLPFFLSGIILLLVSYLTLDIILVSITSFFVMIILFLFETYPHYNNAKLILDEKELVVNNRFYANSVKYSDIKSVNFVIAKSESFFREYLIFCTIDYLSKKENLVLRDSGKTTSLEKFYFLSSKLAEKECEFRVEIEPKIVQRFSLTPRTN